MTPSGSPSIFVAGHRGLVGSAVVRELRRVGWGEAITRAHAELDLEDSTATARFFAEARPRIVVLAAAKVGGILANDRYPVDFLMRNLRIQSNVFESAHANGVERILFLGSSCIYPRDCPQPIREEYLLTGPLEATNRPYALAKIAGVEMCWSYNRQAGARDVAIMPTNLYGPGDNYDLATSHVLPALIRKMHEAKAAGASQVTLWGSGAPRREFLHVDDLARAIVFMASLDEGAYRALTDPSACPLVNVGAGEDQTIRELAQLVADVVGFRGSFQYDRSKPDGTPRKLLDVSRITRLGWSPRIGLREGIASAYADFVRHVPAPA
jgi:GDP-L-fucose synthase